MTAASTRASLVSMLGVALTAFLAVASTSSAAPLVAYPDPSATEPYPYPYCPDCVTPFPPPDYYPGPGANTGYPRYPVYGNVPNAIVCGDGFRWNRYQIDQKINTTLVSQPQDLVPLESRPDDLALACKTGSDEQLYQIQANGDAAVLIVKKDGTYCGAYTHWFTSNTNEARQGNCVACPNYDTPADPADTNTPQGPGYCLRQSGDENYDSPTYYCPPGYYGPGYVPVTDNPAPTMGARAAGSDDKREAAPLPPPDGPYPGPCIAYNWRK